MVELEHRGEVRVMHLGSDENRFNRVSIDGINKALDELATVDGNVSLVVTGDGRYFSNGLDLEWLQTGDEELQSFVHDVELVLHRFLMLDMVTVGAINGHAFAGGAMLAATFDFTVMADGRGWWCLPEVDLGLPLTPAMFAALESHIPRPALAEASLTGRRYSGSQALAAGIVSHAAEPDGVLDRAIEIARANSSKNRKVIAAHKALLHGSG
ncbi:MAG TPA: enoyl-CoA hydratase/isomerase family protein [Ilumatobacter sp.]|nr:enoyl-CoA hydratase/isomerase family protein [Ilumatobacter sp.]